MKIKISKNDVIWNYIGIVVSLAGNFVLVPFLIKFLSTDYYGLWNVFTSLGAISVLFDFGFNSMFARNIAYSWSGVDHLTKENVDLASENSQVNYVLLKKVIRTCQIIYIIISTSALIILSTIGSVYVLNVSLKIHDNKTVLIAWLLFAFGVFLDLLYGYYDAFLRGIGEVGADNKARVISKAIQISLTILLLLLNFGIISVSIANIVYGLIFRGMCKKRFYEHEGLGIKLQQIGKVPSNDILNTFIIVWHNAWREGVVSIANYLSNQVTTLLCSFYLGLAATARFGLAVQFTSAVAQISTALFISYMPAMQESYAHRNFDRLKDYFSWGFVSYLILFPLGIIGIMIFIPFINIIKGKEMLTVSLLVGVGIYQFLLKYRDCYSWYLASTNRVIYYKSFIISALVCTVLSIVLVGYCNLGINGFIISQIISQCIYNVWYWPLYVDKEMNLGFKEKIDRFSKRMRNILQSL